MYMCDELGIEYIPESMREKLQKIKLDKAPFEKVHSSHEVKFSKSEIENMKKKFMEKIDKHIPIDVRKEMKKSMNYLFDEIQSQGIDAVQDYAREHNMHSLNEFLELYKVAQAGEGVAKFHEIDFSDRRDIGGLV